MIDRSHLGIKKQKSQLRRVLRAMGMPLNEVKCIEIEFEKALSMYPALTPEELTKWKKLSEDELLYLWCNGSKTSRSTVLSHARYYAQQICKKLPWIREIMENTVFGNSIVVIELLYEFSHDLKNNAARALLDMDEFKEIAHSLEGMTGNEFDVFTEQEKTKLKQLWGDKFHQNLAYVRGLTIDVEEVFPGFVERLERSGLGSSSALIVQLFALQRPHSI